MNNIEKIKAFFLSSNKNLLVNSISEEIDQFYLYLIKKASEELQIQIIYNDSKTANVDNNDLFNQQKFYLFSNIEYKKIKEILDSKQKNIIFCSYNNFKKFKLDLKISSYDYAKDIRNYLNQLNINNNLLSNLIQTHPYLIKSEVEKYLISKDSYVPNYLDKFSDEKIKDIRIEIYKSKKEHDLPKTYSLIKNEVSLKKFNFLIY